MKFVGIGSAGLAGTSHARGAQYADFYGEWCRRASVATCLVLTELLPE